MSAFIKNKLLVARAANKPIALDLVSGQQMTVRVVEVTDTNVTVKDPIVFTPMMQGPGQLTIGNLPYGAPLYQPDKEFPIEFIHIVMVLPVRAEMEDAYTRATSSVIAPPKPSLVVPA